MSSSAPLFFDITYPYGDPDVISTTGKTATASYSAPEVGPGDWTVTPFLVGPTGAKPASNVTANIVDDGDHGRLRLGGQLPDRGPVAGQHQRLGDVHAVRGQPRPERHHPGDVHAQRARPGAR